MISPCLVKSPMKSLPCLRPPSRLRIPSAVRSNSWRVCPVRPRCWCRPKHFRGWAQPKICRDSPWIDQWNLGICYDLAMKHGDLAIFFVVWVEDVLLKIKHVNLTGTWKQLVPGRLEVTPVAGQNCRCESSGHGHGGEICQVTLPIPSGNLLHSYLKWPFIADLPIKNGDFP